MPTLLFRRAFQSSREVITSTPTLISCGLDGIDDDRGQPDIVGSRELDH
jgi:hypothetical protein